MDQIIQDPCSAQDAPLGEKQWIDVDFASQVPPEFRDIPSSASLPMGGVPIAHLNGLPVSTQMPSTETDDNLILY